MNVDFLPRAERQIAKKGDFWGGLESMSSGAGLMADWEWAFGSALSLVMPFLRPTEKQSESFPCPARPPCECRHEVQETDFGLVAVCMCGECEPFRIEPKDVLVYGLDFGRFGDAVRRALGFAESSGAAYVSAGLREIGRYAAVAAPVYLSIARSGALLRELQRLVGLRDGPFILLTPSGNGWTPEVEAMVRPCGAGHIALASVLDLGIGERREESGERSLDNGTTDHGTTDHGTTGQKTTSPCPSPRAAERVTASGGLFKSKGTIEPMLAEFARRVAAARGPGAVLTGIHQEIASVRKEFGELRTAKQRLEKMLADGMFAFTRKVGTSFKIFCTILAEGDVAKAGTALGMADSTLRDVVRGWGRRGKEYVAMLDLVRWRKKVGRRETVALNENIGLGKAESHDFPDLLSNVLEGLLGMTEQNWQERCEELAEMLRPVV